MCFCANLLKEFKQRKLPNEKLLPCAAIQQSENEYEMKINYCVLVNLRFPIMPDLSEQASDINLSHISVPVILYE